MRLMIFALTFALSGVHVRAQVVTSEFFSDPISEGWELLQLYCEPEIWAEGGVFHESLDFEACGEPPPPGEAQDDWVVGIDEFNGVLNWFYEFRVSATGPSSEIFGGAPTAFASFNSFGENYRFVVSRDLVEFWRDFSIPEVYIEVEPWVPHTIRVELNNEGIPTYKMFIDGVLIDEGIGEDVFPSDNSRITWRGRAWYEPTENAWYYIRYGIPSTSPGDFDSDGDVDQRDAFYFAECVAERGNGPDVPADPGCADWADLDGDGDIDFADFGIFQRIFTGSD